MNDNVNAIAVSGSVVYVGGRFTSPANRIARWNGVGWGGLGSGIIGSEVNGLAVSGTNLYAGGFFTSAGGNSATNIAKWDGISWSSVGDSLYGTVNSLFASDGNLFAGGYFTASGDVELSRVALWNGSVWSGLATNIAIGGIGSVVNALVISETNLLVGGFFRAANGSASNYVVTWNGTTWLPLGAAMNGGIRALAVSDTNLYVGGNFNSIGGIAANRVAKWDGVAWSGLGSLIPGIVGDFGVNALAASGDDLYAGGFFTTASGGAGNYIAQWNGSTWTGLGSGMNSTVYALVASGNDLYAGGSFTTAGGISARRVAKWNGTNWVTTGLGLSGTVSALAVSGTNVYAGGSFTYATNTGGLSLQANRIAKWDGNVWSALGLGVNAPVYSLAMSGPELFAGGAFMLATNSNGLSLTANRIARWEGSEWSALGSGVNDYVNALTAYGTCLYVGGSFTAAGTNASAYVAKANIGAARGRFSDLLYSLATGFSCTFLDASVGQPYRIQTSPSLTVAPWSDLTNFTYTGPVVITDASAVSTSNTFYRAVTP